VNKKIFIQFLKPHGVKMLLNSSNFINVLNCRKPDPLYFQENLRFFQGLYKNVISRFDHKLYFNTKNEVSIFDDKSGFVSLRSNSIESFIKDVWF